MAMRYGYFDSEITGVDSEGMPIFDRAETSELFRLLFSKLLTNGVLAKPADCFKVLAGDTGLTVKVQPGFGLINGAFAYDPAVATFELAAAPTSYSRIDRIVLGIKTDGTPYTCAELGATGALLALLLEATKPNLVQSIEGNLAFVHGGPFANIAHGCNSVAATYAALKLGEYAITEAGFGSDLGAEKFFNIKCRAAGLEPAAVVLVTSTKALKWHGGVPLPEIGKPNMEALKRGLCNLEAHIENLKHFGPNIVVSLNHFHTDEDAEIEVIRARAAELGVRFAVCDGFAKGGDGAIELAQAVIEAAADPKPLVHTYEPEQPILEKIDAIVTKVYGGAGADLSDAAKKDLKRLQDLGFDRLPVCIAKTPFSLTADAKALGAPKGFRVPVQRLILNAGAGFIVVTTGAIMRMPGLPKAPAAMQIDVVDGRIVGLS